MAAYFRPREILELGGGMGISTLFMAAGNPESAVHSVEAVNERFLYAGKESGRLGIGNIRHHKLGFDEFLASYQPASHPLMVFIDGDHKGDSMIGYFNTLKSQLRKDSIIILDDIRWSGDTFSAWEQIRNDPVVTVSIDLFFYGILFFREGITKQDFKIQF
jgi:predicted O-methyltransferase YrrM